MFKYTTSAILNTFDLIKKIIFATLVVFQIGYIGYIVTRIFNKSGSFIINVVLLALSVIYLIYYISTYREFYTEDHKRNRMIVKWSFKSVKYAINVYLIALAVIELANGTNKNDNTSIITIIIMLLTLFLTITFDIVILIIDQQATLIKNGLRYDMEEFTENNKFFTFGIRKMGFDIKERVPAVESHSIKVKLDKIHKEQTEKKERKISFFEKYKKRKEKAQ